MGGLPSSSSPPLGEFSAGRGVLRRADTPSSWGGLLPGGRTSDIAHDAELMLRGYHVIRIGYEQLMHGWPEVQSLILAAVAQRRHLAA